MQVTSIKYLHQQKKSSSSLVKHDGMMCSQLKIVYVTLNLVDELILLHALA